MSTLLETLRQLVMLPGVSGFEDPVRNFLVKRLKELGLEPRVDSLGNVIVEIGEGRYTMLFCAHMDEVGLIVTYIEPDGKLKFRKVGGVDDRVLQQQIVQLYTPDGKSITGIIAVPPPHIQLKRDQQIVPWHDLYIDLGLESRQDVESLGIKPPCPAVLMKHFTVIGRGDHVAARSIDDRAGCAVLLELAKFLSSQHELHRKYRYVLAWTAQEEIGLRGAKALTVNVHPDIVYVLDTVTCCNPVITGDMRLGAGPVLRILDNEFMAPVHVVRRIWELAREQDIACQICTAGGTTDALELQEMNVPTVPIGIPVKYSHSSVEMCHVKDLEEWLKLMYMVAQTQIA